MSSFIAHTSFRRVRVAILLGALVSTVAWAADTSYRRWERGKWHRPLQVGIVLLSPDGRLNVDHWRRGAGALSAQLHAEMERWHGPGAAPFHIAVIGPVPWSGPLPLGPPSDSPLDRTFHALDVWRTIREIEGAAGEAAGGFDVRIFFLAQPMQGGQVGFAEGTGAMNGEVAFVRGSPGGDLSIPLQAIGHELLHTVGATDKYDDNGHAREPEGLADPGRAPRYPQVHAEWMVGEVALGPERGRLPDSIEDLRVGPTTAQEIGWRGRPGTAPGLAAR